MMHGILLRPDPTQQKIVASDVSVQRSPNGDASLSDLYRLLECGCIDITPCNPDGPLAGHVAVVDDNGLCDPSRQVFLYCPAIGSQPYAGNVLLMKVDEFGNLQSATVALNEVREVTKDSYVSRGFARAALAAWEAQVSDAYPGAIVVRTSMEM